MSNYISYYNIINDRNNFRKAGTKSGSDFNLFDTPSHKYFKLFFYFNNGDVSGSYGVDAGNGLLTPTWFVEGVNDENYYMHNSAWSYLKMNDEDDRAILLQEFVNLLSNISSESPWYFSEIAGLETAMERKAIHADNFTVEAARQKMTIKCLPDSADDRIGTLLDLYRSITWDWTTKRFILPPNLRKFDMGIFIFETPNLPTHKIETKSVNGMPKTEYSSIGDGTQEYQTSYKYIELHNCEIDYNSSKSLYATLNNKEGSSTEYNIDIYFDDCYEARYNEFMMKDIGDIIKDSAKQQMYHDNNFNKLNDRLNYYEYKNEELEINNNKWFNFDSGKFLKNAAGQLINLGKDHITRIIKKAILGNLHTFSLTRMSDQVKGLIQGDILSTARHVNNYIKSSNKNSPHELTNANIFPKKTISPTVKKIGNLYQGNTIANNI